MDAVPRRRGTSDRTDRSPRNGHSRRSGLHGHRHAIDAMLSATALATPGPVTVLTSDPEDIATLCGRNVTIIKVLRDGPGAKRAGRAGSLQPGRLGYPVRDYGRRSLSGAVRPS